ncbi:helicase C-terminal domain-containing protein [Brachyspira sp. G79]|uniref:helicase C-terminal domain-containing protein n=1 Tax=Brachyspira sp. G79 TaxID=1358104 RepID=UPI000BBCBD2B|nr:helicase C-terminal domain-containing protein [Brachyspira sp. G79]PCG19329.1 helicase [Brachyspira sp. G79]
MSNNYDREIDSVFSTNAISYMRKAIVDAYGNEVYFGINFNAYGILDYIEVMARGNKDSVPAIISLSLEFDAVIHNHPSGQLTPSRPDLAIASELGNNAGVGFYIVNNDVDEYYEVVKPIKAENIKTIDVPDALYMFTENGTLSKLLKKYEYRQEQTELVEATIESFNNNKHLISEAGTGIGKSFAYLVPALLWLKENKTRIVISTNTINLQEQIISKDIPSIIGGIAPNVKYALVKGRNNYVCIKKVKDALNDTDRLDFEEQVRFFEDINNWLNITKDGSITDLGYKPQGELWEMVACDTDTCTHRKCEYLEDCYFYKMRKQLNAAQLLIVNHHILCADLSLYAETAGRYSLLPRYTKVLIDEAHNFENSASSYFGDEGSKNGISKALFYISRIKKNKRLGIIESINNMLNEKKSLIEKHEYDEILDLINKAHDLTSRVRNVTEDKTKEFMNYCHKNIQTKEGLGYKFRISPELVSTNHWKNDGLKPLREMVLSMTSLVNICDKLYKKFFDIAIEKDFDYEEIAQMANAYLERLKRQLVSLNAVIDYKKDEYIRWIETRLTKKGSLILNWHLTPVTVAKNLNDFLYSRFDTVAMYSATLTVSKSFNFFSNRLGFDYIEKNKKIEIYLESPFNYEDNARLYIAADMPDVASDTFNDFTSKVLLDVCDITGGRAFILFTSFSSLMSVYENTAKKLKSKNINALAQTASVHRHTLLDMFKSSSNNVLYGVDSFWEGVDVAGKNLEVVIIPKLPFAVPTDPISEGRYRYIEENGGNAFLDYALPFAVIKFKQGFGRLIRSKDDRGVVFVLDKRLYTKNYGIQFIQSLPNAKVIKASMREIFNDMNNFFDY